MRRTLALVLSLALPVLYVIARYAGIQLVQLADIMFMLFTGSCTLLAFMMVKRVGASGKLGLVHVGMFTCMLLIFLGTVTNGICVIILRVVTPFPSVTDALNFLGYASATIAGLQFLLYFRAAFTEWRYKLIPLLGALVGCPNLILSHPSMALQMSLIADAAWFAYPILDAVLAVIAIMMLLLFSGGILSPPWRWFGTGMILITTADAIVGVSNVQGWSQFVQPFYLFYFWGYICLGLGFSLTIRLERLHPLEPDLHKSKFMRPLDWYTSHNP